MTLAILATWHAWLMPAAIFGAPFTRSGLQRMLTRPGWLAAPLAVIVVVLFNAFGLVQRGESRYVLLAFPPLAAVATTAVARAGPLVVGGLVSARLGGRARRIVQAGLLVTLVALGLDPDRLLADARARDVASTWVQAVEDRRPNDLIVSFAPTLTTHYLGRTDVWLRSEGYEKYVWAGQPPLRDVHSGALVVRDLRELDSLLLRPNRGRTAWVILAGDPAREVSPRAREVATTLMSRATDVRRPPDGRIVLRVPL